MKVRYFFIWVIWNSIYKSFTMDSPPLTSFQTQTSFYSHIRLLPKELRTIICLKLKDIMEFDLPQYHLKYIDEGTPYDQFLWLMSDENFLKKYVEQLIFDQSYCPSQAKAAYLINEAKYKGNPTLMSLLFKKHLQQPRILNCFSEYVNLYEAVSSTEMLTYKFMGQSTLFFTLLAKWKVHPLTTIKFDLDDIKNNFYLCKKCLSYVNDKHKKLKNIQLHLSCNLNTNADELLAFLRKRIVQNFHLTLSFGPPMDDQGAKKLALLPNLTGLNLRHNRNSFIKNGNLKLLTNLKSLDLGYNNNICNKGLSALTNLTTLYLGRDINKNTYDGLKKLTNLTHLDIHRTMKTESSNPLLTCLPHSNGGNRSQELSDRNLMKLRARLPNLVIYDKGEVLPGS